MKRLIAIVLFALCVGTNGYCQEIDTLAVADSCAHAFNMPKAIGLYEEYLSNHIDEQATRNLAECYRKEGRYDAAIARLQAIDSTRLTHSDKRALFFAYESLGKTEDIELWGNKVVEEYPYDGEVVAALSAYYNDTFRPLLADSIALIYYANVDTANVFVNRQLAYACYLNKKYDNALRLYLQLQSCGFDNYESCFIIGDCYERADSLSEAFRYFEKALQWKNGNDYNCLYRMGKVSLAMSDASMATKYLKEAENLLQPDPEMIYSINKSLAAAYFSIRQYAASADCFDKCVNAKPDDIIAYYNAAQMYCAAKMMDEARSYLKQFLSLSVRLEESQENKDIIENAKRQMEKWK